MKCSVVVSLAILISLNIGVGAGQEVGTADARLSDPAFIKVRDEAVERLVESFFGSKDKLKEFLETGSGDVLPRIVHEPAAASAFDETLL